jgi:hypothetical protein
MRKRESRHPGLGQPETQNHVCGNGSFPRSSHAADRKAVTVGVVKSRGSFRRLRITCMMEGRANRLLPIAARFASISRPDKELI